MYISLFYRLDACFLKIISLYGDTYLAADALHGDCKWALYAPACMACL